jgi:L-ascorbate metabolism protein UlaG (beta-lactamase superfamily)
MAESGPLRLTWVGHSTVLIELDGARFLTDPLLRTRVGHLRRLQPVDPAGLGPLDAVLISHGHYDHLDVPSLRKLDPSTPLVVPRGGASMLRRAGRKSVVEASPGDELELGGIQIRATPAEHKGSGGLRKGDAIGFLLHGSATVYFAGDTDLFDAMADVAPVDVALLPVWGWGKTLGEGHLDPRRAATAAGVVGARIAVPIHWGTYRPVHHRPGTTLTEPPLEFRRAVAELAPGTRVEVLALGETLELPSLRALS